MLVAARSKWLAFSMRATLGGGCVVIEVGAGSSGTSTSTHTNSCSPMTGGPCCNPTPAKLLKRLRAGFEPRPVGYEGRVRLHKKQIQPTTNRKDWILGSRLLLANSCSKQAPADVERGIAMFHSSRIPQARLQKSTTGDVK